MPIVLGLVIFVIIVWVFLVALAVFLIPIISNRGKSYPMMCSECKNVNDIPYGTLFSARFTKVIGGFNDNTIGPDGLPLGRHTSYIVPCPHCNKSVRSHLLVSSTLPKGGRIGIIIAMASFLIVPVFVMCGLGLLIAAAGILGNLL